MGIADQLISTTGLLVHSPITCLIRVAKLPLLIKIPDYLHKWKLNPETFPPRSQMHLAYKLCHKISPTPLATFRTTKPEHVTITAVSAG